MLHWKGPDLTTYGELVLEGTFKVHRAKNERTLFLFDRMLLITKRRGEHYVYKANISVRIASSTTPTHHSYTNISHIYYNFNIYRRNICISIFILLYILNIYISFLSYIWILYFCT